MGRDNGAVNFGRAVGVLGGDSACAVVGLGVLSLKQLRALRVIAGSPKFQNVAQFTLYEEVSSLLGPVLGSVSQRRLTIGASN